MFLSVHLRCSLRGCPAAPECCGRRYALRPRQLFVALFSREALLVQRHWFVYAFRLTQVPLLPSLLHARAEQPPAWCCAARALAVCASLSSSAADGGAAQSSALAIFTATLFIRPTMPRNNLSDANKYAGFIFFSLINIFFDGLPEMAILLSTLPVIFKQRDNRQVLQPCQPMTCPGGPLPWCEVSAHDLSPALVALALALAPWQAATCARAVPGLGVHDTDHAAAPALQPRLLWPLGLVSPTAVQQPCCWPQVASLCSAGADVVVPAASRTGWWGLRRMRAGEPGCRSP